MEISRGRVKWFNANKGYGFITPDNPENGDVYVHFSQIVGKGFVSLTTGQTVDFNIVTAEKGLAAVNVRVVNPTVEAV
ncbi:MAG TPA: cold-shock protein [Candidatus Angelobacter sp.]|nr:cold-shock protein [Candidatus Angelobacter sp.]